jgi:hypothetical protein
MSAREPLPNRRYCETVKLRHGHGRAAYHVTIGQYEDGRVAEVFLSTNQTGSALDAMARDLAVLMSLALQHGCALETIKHALTREANGEPATIAGAVVDKLLESRR